MAYTTETTVVAGTTIDASWANTNVRDNVEYLATNAPACRVFNSATISHTTSAAYQALTYDSERFDNATMHSTSSNQSRIIATAAGKYVVGGGLEFAASATGQRNAALKINGATFVGQDGGGSTGGGGINCNPSAFYSFAVSDYVEMLGYQNSGGALNMNLNANISIEAWAFWVRN